MDPCAYLPKWPRYAGGLLIFFFAWSYENRVSKHFVIFLNFSCLTACLLCCLFMSCFFFFACFVVRDLCRSGCRQNYYLIPPPLIFPYPQFFLNASDSYQFEISGRLKLVSVPFSSLVLYIGHLEKSFPESIM